MPHFRPTPDCDLFYRDDDFTDPWTTPETILMLHGNAESSLSWYAWAPKLARHYRVIRPDMRGFGQSSPMPAEYPWTMDGLTADYCALMDHLGVDRFHVVAAKIGGTIARAFAARRPDRVKTLSVIGTPAPLRVGVKEKVPQLIANLKAHGVEAWALENMGTRLGSEFPKEGVEWWGHFMGRTALSTQLGFMGTIACADIREDLPKIACPTLVVTTEKSGLGTPEETRAWQQQIKNSELVVLPGDSYHVATSHAEPASDAVLGFIARHQG